MDRLLTSPPLLGGLHQLTQLQLFKRCPIQLSLHPDLLPCAQYVSLLMDQLRNLTQLRAYDAGGVLGFDVATLRHLVFLEELDLEGCKIGPEAAPALAQVSLPAPTGCFRLSCWMCTARACTARAALPALALPELIHCSTALHHQHHTAAALTFLFASLLQGHHFASLCVTAGASAYACTAAAEHCQQ